MRRVTVIGLIATFLGTASPAQARVVRAENVLPPGQSGYVSIAGFASGEGSPHLYDQTELFVNFERK